MILVTGGCGFIGKHLVTDLTRKGFEVRVLDSLSRQVHGESPDTSWLKDCGAELVVGDVCRPSDCAESLKGVDTVFHLAAETGTGQSMYEIRRYAETNVTGTATMLEECLRAGVGTFVLSSSRAVYGEGVWSCAKCGPVRPGIRTCAGEKDGWNPHCPSCGEATESPLPTSEVEASMPVSVYGATKAAQEELALLMHRSGKISARVLRFFNVYGPGQSLSNPYTGVLGVFVNRAIQGKSLDVYEDGLIKRDFVFIDDVVNALVEASRREFDGAVNIGSGETVTVMDLAREIANLSGAKPQISITGKTRIGDVRGLVADIGKASMVLGWRPGTAFSAGLRTYAEWALSQDYVDRYEESLKELRDKGLYT